MSQSETERLIRDVLTQNPFVCDAVFLYRAEGDELVPLDEASWETFVKFQSAIRAVRPEGTVWVRETGQTDRRPERGLCYGAVQVGNLVVAVMKRFAPAEAQARGAFPIDGYFLDTLRQRVEQVLSSGPEVEEVPVMVPGAIGAPEVFAELRVLDQMRGIWRAKYGSAEWLVVHNGQVVAHGKDRRGVEKMVAKMGVASPVVYVPPGDADEAIDIFPVEDHA